jgi:hypothetical protein
MEVLALAAALATALNSKTKGFRDCRVSEDSAGLRYSFDTTSDAENFLSKRTKALEGKPMSVFASGANVYEYRKDVMTLDLVGSGKVESALANPGGDLGSY